MKFILNMLYQPLNSLTPSVSYVALRTVESCTSAVHDLQYANESRKAALALGALSHAYTYVSVDQVLSGVNAHRSLNVRRRAGGLNESNNMEMHL